MQKRILENTELETSAIGFGTASLHHLLWQSERLKLLETAYSNGITHFDTAPCYGFGLAENDIGLFATKRRNSITITTKVGLYSPDRNPTSISIRVRKLFGRIIPNLAMLRCNWDVNVAKKSFETSLRRLKTDFVDFLLLHEPISASMNQDHFLEWLQTLKTAGKIRSWGVAGSTPSIATWVENRNMLADVVQTKDSVENHEADFLIKCGRKLQFTYGYLINPQANQSKQQTISLALKRNATGTIIVSSRKNERIREMAKYYP